MSSVNKVILVGHLGRDPETKYSASGDAVTNVSIATSSKWTDKQTGDKKEETEWHRITFFGKLAEVAGQYLAKGAQIYIEGRLKTNKWTDKDGIERYATGIIADRLQMLGSKADNERRQREAGQDNEPERASPDGSGTRQAAGATGETMKDLDDDVPF